MLWAVIKGGPVMIPIILASVLGLAIILEKLWMLRRVSIDAGGFADAVIRKVRAGELDDAIDLCIKKRSYPVASTLLSGLEAYSKRRPALHEIERVLERAGNAEVNSLEKHIGGLISVIGIEPLLGFLGTITGLIKAFMSWEAAGSNVTVSQLAGGMYEAMVTTAAGLIVAVPYYLVCNYIVSRIKYISFELGDASMRLVEAIAEIGYKA